MRNKIKKNSINGSKFMYLDKDYNLLEVEPKDGIFLKISIYSEVKFRYNQKKQKFLDVAHIKRVYFNICRAEWIFIPDNPSSSDFMDFQNANCGIRDGKIGYQTIWNMCVDEDTIKSIKKKYCDKIETITFNLFTDLKYNIVNELKIKI